LLTGIHARVENDVKKIPYLQILEISLVVPREAVDGWHGSCN
jgi:hypothetical protein